VCNTGQPRSRFLVNDEAVLDETAMVEFNKDVDRLARIEGMLQALEREAAVLKTTTARIIDVIQVTRTLTTPRTSGTSVLPGSSQRRPAKASLRGTADGAARRRA
jgi:hypothetical protein